MTFACLATNFHVPSFFIQILVYRLFTVSLSDPTVSLPMEKTIFPLITICSISRVKEVLDLLRTGLSNVVLPAKLILLSGAFTTKSLSYSFNRVMVSLLRTAWTSICSSFLISDSVWWSWANAGQTQKIHISANVNFFIWDGLISFPT
jgi:hypothetical protein